MKSILIVALAVLSFVGCRREDVREIEVEVAGMKEADLDFVVGRLAGIPYATRSAQQRQILGGYRGVRDGVNPETKSPTRVIEVDFNPQTQRLKMKYDSMQVAEKNLEMSIAEAGFVVRRVVRDKDGKDVTANQRPVLPKEVGLMVCTVILPEMTTENLPLIMDRLVGIPYHVVRILQEGKEMTIPRRSLKGDDFNDFMGGLKAVRDANRPMSGYPCGNPLVQIQTDFSQHSLTFRYLMKGSEEAATADIRGVFEEKKGEQDVTFKVANIKMSPFEPTVKAQ